MDNRFIPWFKVELEELPEQGGSSGLAGAAAGAAVAAATAAAATGSAAGAVAGAAGSLLTGLLPISRDFYDGDFRLELRYGTNADTFQATIAGLSGQQYDKIKVDKTVIKISLGYYGGKQRQIFEGVVQRKQVREGESFYETVLSGMDKAAYLLQRKCFGDGDIAYEESRDLLDILEDIRDQANVPLEVHGAARDASLTRLDRRLSFERKTAFEGFTEMQRRVRQIEGHSLALRGGKMWYGKKDGNDNNTGRVFTDVLTNENFIAHIEPVTENQNGPARVCPPSPSDSDGVAGGLGIAGAALGAAASAVGGAIGALAGAALGALFGGSGEPGLGFDFTLLGDPDLHPGDTITMRVKNHNNVESNQNLTIESITHDYSRASGYRCTGRALAAATFLTSVYNARAPGAAALGAAMEDQRERSQERSPAVNIGDIAVYTPADQLVDVRLGLQATPTMSSPSVQIQTGTEGYRLRRRPLASPFAWNYCGMVFPVYPGMRAVALHNQYLREDALLEGFIWTEEMRPPPSQRGDYWLCLPMDIGENQTPNQSNRAANDLITGDGKRVIQLKGLKIQIGQALQSNLDTRPSPGSDDELLIEHSSGAQIKMTNGQIELKAGGRTVSIASGKVSIS